MSNEHDDTAIPMGDILNRVSETISDDAARRAALQDNGDQGLGPVEEPPAPLATPELTKQADVPSFSAFDGLARGLATSMAEIQQRLAEVHADIDASGISRDQLVSRIHLQLEDDIDRMKENADRLIDIVNGNHQQEVAILRGRETDLVNTGNVLDALQSKLRR